MQSATGERQNNTYLDTRICKPLHLMTVAGIWIALHRGEQSYIFHAVAYGFKRLLRGKPGPGTDIKVSRSRVGSLLFSLITDTSGRVGSLCLRGMHVVPHLLFTVTR